MSSCTERADRSQHCCWIAGQVCEFLSEEFLCTKWDSLGDSEWQNAPVGRFFADHYPGYTCHDWPQNIPEAMAAGRGLCCWQGDV